MTDEVQTKPTLETLSKQMEGMRSEMTDMRSEMAELRSEMRAGFAAINYMFEQMDIRFDRLESVAYGAHSQVVNLRADFKEFRVQFRAPA
jgi:uncharacterized coiled-coil DUF342 family protein